MTSPAASLAVSWDTPGISYALKEEILAGRHEDHDHDEPQHQLQDQCVVEKTHGGRTLVRECNIDLVLKNYRRLMRGPVREVFRDGYLEGRIFKSKDIARNKLPALEGAIREAMLTEISQPLCERWQLYNSNLFPREWATGLGLKAEDSPIVLTLNCAPVDDGSICSSAKGSAPLWTPDYLTDILVVLKAAGRFPLDVVPLCVEYRPICPLCVALTVHPFSLDDINQHRHGPSSFLGWHCGSYGETQTSTADRALYGAYTSLVHGAATRSWIGVTHAKAITRLADSEFDALDPRVGLGVPADRSPDRGGAWISPMGHDGGATKADESKTGEAASTTTAADLDVSLESDPVLTLPPGQMRLRLCLDAVHPGRDIYLHGAALSRNVKTWGIVGAILQRMKGDVDRHYAANAASEDPEPGLSPELARRALHEASLAEDELLRSGDLPLLVSRVVHKLARRGHSHVFVGGPHADDAAEAVAGVGAPSGDHDEVGSSGEEDDESDHNDASSLATSLETMTLEMMR